MIVETREWARVSVGGIRRNGPVERRSTEFSMSVFQIGELVNASFRKAGKSHQSFFGWPGFLRSNLKTNGGCTAKLSQRFAREGAEPASEAGENLTGASKRA
jgi:hypothetical protein